MRLYGEADEALDHDDPNKALRLASEMRKNGYSGAYEIAARAFWFLGEEERAIETLQDGVAKYPQVAILWSYLGEYLSNLARYEEAIEAFAKSAEGLAGSPDMAAYNIGVARWRQGRGDDALEALRGMGPGGPPDHMKLELEATVLIDLGRIDEAETILNDLIERGPKIVDRHEMSRILGLLAEVRWARGDGAEAVRHATDAVGFDKANPRPARILRIANGRTAEDARIFRVQVEGVWPEPIEGGRAGFFASYRVVACPTDDLLDYIRPFEREAAESLKIAEAHADERMPDEPLGVWEAQAGYTFFRRFDD